MTTGYGDARARQVRVLLWVTLALSVLPAVAALRVLAQGATRFGLFILVPAVLAIATSALAIGCLRTGRPTKLVAAAAGALLVIEGVVLVQLLVGVAAIVLGLFLVMFALLPEPSD